MRNIGVREKYNTVSVGMGRAIIIGLNILLHFFIFPAVSISNIRIKLLCFLVLFFCNSLLIQERIGMRGNMGYDSFERNIAGCMIHVVMCIDQDFERFTGIFLKGVDQVFGLF